MAARARSVADLLPRWTTRAATDLSGRDPLGLSRVGQFLADRLLPGIITQTDRARYYALYCWILWHIEHEDPPGSWQSFANGFQRREAAIALATLLEDPSASPVGKIAVQKRLREGETGDVNTAFQVLPATVLGGFGQYYGGCMHQLGLTFRSDDGIDRVAKGLGESLAKTVQETVQSTPYIKKRLFADKEVDRRALKRSAERLTLDAILLPEAAAERSLLRELFFGFGAAAPAVKSARQASLARILATLQAYEKAGVSVTEDRLDHQLLYAPTYFGVLVSDKDRTTPLPPLHGLEWCSDIWRQYCLHQFFTQALESLLDALLRVLGTVAGGMALEDAIRHLTDREFPTYLKLVTGRASKSPLALLGAFGIETAPDERACRKNRRTFGWSHPQGEWACERDAARPGQIAARACLTLATLYAKWRCAESDSSYRDVGIWVGDALCAQSFLPQLDSWLVEDLQWSDAIHSLVAMLVQRHDRVMYEKGRLESCWLHTQEGRYVRDQDYDPYFRAPRHRQAAQILADLKLVRWDGPKKDRSLRLTGDGKRVLSQAMAELA